jgi:hypothetical protein
LAFFHIFHIYHYSTYFSSIFSISFQNFFHIFHSWILKRYRKYGRKVSWIVKWFGNIEEK